jgi:hypothetical protein
MGTAVLPRERSTVELVATSALSMEEEVRRSPRLEQLLACTLRMEVIDPVDGAGRGRLR